MTQDPEKLDKQLDELIEETKQVEGAPASEPTAEPAAHSAEADEQQLVEQIDQMLASSAEEAVADEIKPAQQTTEAPPAEADELQGDFHAPEDLADEEPATTVAQSETAVVEEQADEGSAAAVADELDAAEQQDLEEIEPVRESPEDEPYDPGVQYPRDLRPPLTIRVMAAMNKPVMSWPVFRRDLLGYVGLETALFGFCLLVYVMLGGTATMVTAVIGCAVLLAMFYVLFIRTPREESGLVLEAVGEAEDAGEERASDDGPAPEPESAA